MRIFLNRNTTVIEILFLIANVYGCIGNYVLQTCTKASVGDVVGTFCYCSRDMCNDHRHHHRHHRHHPRHHHDLVTQSPKSSADMTSAKLKAVETASTIQPSAESSAGNIHLSTFNILLSLRKERFQ